MKTRIVTAMALFLVAMTLLASSNASAEEPGFLFLPHYIQGDRGTIPPLHVVHAHTGAEMPLETVKADLSPGRQIPLPPGDYHVELGQFRSPANRRLYRIEAGKVTVIKSGLLRVALSPKADRIALCPGWTLNVTVYVREGERYVPVASDVSLETPRYGTVQLHAGEYLLEWNRMALPVTIEERTRLTVHPSAMAPVKGYAKPQLIPPEVAGFQARHKLQLCTNHNLFLFPGTYQLTHRVKTNSYPYYRVATDELTVDEHRDFLDSDRLPRLKGKASRTRGPGGQGEAVPLPTPATDTDPNDEEPQDAPTDPPPGPTQPTAGKQ